MKKKEKAVTDETFEWKIVEPWPEHWVWIERNGMRIKPASGRLGDLVRPPNLPKLTEEEVNEILAPDRDDER